MYADVKIEVLVIIFVLNIVNCVVLFPRNFDSDKTFDNIIEINNGCQCIPAYFCADDENAALYGDGLLDIRSSGTNSCPNYFEVCCENPLKEIPSKNEIIKGCGYKNPNGVAARITSGSDQTLFGELPWTIVILLRNSLVPEQHIYKCGGSLIHPQVVLTAAHCVSGTEPKQIIVRAGEWDTRTLKEPVPHQNVDVQETTIHQHYNERSLKNDIALLFLVNEITMLDNVGIICLPPQGLEIDNIHCTASGWGKNAFKKGKHSSILKKIDLPLIAKADCQQALRKTRLGPFYTLHKSFMCAGGETNKDTCKGDGGSPLVCHLQNADGSKTDRYFQIGIVSWGIGCGGAETPGVYVNVPMYTDWIDKQLAAKNFDTTVYKY